MSAKMEATVRSQIDIHGRIARTMDNLKKRGAAKLTIGVLESRLTLLDSLWTEFKDNHTTLIRQHWKELSETEYMREDLFEAALDDFTFQRGAITDMLSARRSESASADPSPALPSEGPALRSLPRIRLPQFSGKFEEWPAFAAMFSSLIQREARLTSVEKLYHLKGCLSEGAARLLEKVAITEKNFETAWATLTEFYQNKRVIVTSCLESVQALPVLQTESAEGLTRLYQELVSSAATLEGIGRPVTSSADFYVHFFTTRFDPLTRREWETAQGPTKDPPSFEALKTFLADRVHTVTALHSRRGDAASTSKSNPDRHSSKTARSHLAQQPHKVERRCVLCQREHYVFHCPDYLRKSPAERKATVEGRKLCLNCLGNHALSSCSSKRGCITCGERHHSSIHEACQAASTSSSAVSTLHTQPTEERNRLVLLATALVHVADSHGQLHQVRALIDSASEVSLAAEALVQRLHLPRRAASVSILGAGGTRTARARGAVLVDLNSRCTQFSMRVMTLVLPRISAYSHRIDADTSKWRHLRGLSLADPEFCSGDQIELLLGAEVYAAILRNGLRRGGPATPIAHRSSLGWLVTGPVNGQSESTAVSAHQCTATDDLTALVRRFWEQEEVPCASDTFTESEKVCEDHYQRTTSRTSDGRYQVRLPMADPSPLLRGSRRAATRVLHAMERRFQHNAGFHTLYRQFLAEYEALGHMSIASLPADETRVCYLPHHGVLKTTDSGAKIRVVFNGSARLLSESTLNSSLLTGPNLLPALPDILLRWRWHRFAVVADIEKMYRQILVHPDDRDLQRIVWRKDVDQEPRDYRLNTVTYGLACAPFLAIRTLHQLAMDEAHRFPRGADVLRKDVYVDDILTGADTLDEAHNIRIQLTQLCMAGGFPLRKWAASDVSILDDIPLEHRSLPDPASWRADAGHSALGLHWRPLEDSFAFRVRRSEPTTVITKRAILAQTARLFDPLGWLSPVIVRAKILLQSMWLQGVDWDDPVRAEDEQLWRRLQEELPLLEAARVPRWLGTVGGGCLEIHGFADASERAMAAVVYLRASEGSTVRTSLLVAKTRVAPTRQISLPRLELCAAALLSRLVAHTQQVLGLTDVRTHLWSDSTVALAWIHGHPSRWQTFVANRVSDIQSLLPGASWHHVPGGDNPADCASRGLSPAETLTHPLWWRGPPWLLDGVRPGTHPPPIISEEDLPERRATVHAASTEPTEEELPILHRCSEWHRLLRVTSWCRRWLSAGGRRSGANASLTTQELTEAQNCWIRLIQARWYAAEIQALTRRQCTPSRSALTKLTPFVDDQGILRVGGRLKNAALSPDERHPVILPAASHLTILLIRSCHLRTLHGGAQLTLGRLRQRFWVPRGRAAVKHYIHRCPPCVRWRAAPSQPIMGNLPQTRLTASRPFLHTGIDYAGPVLLRTTRGRGHKSYKAFLAVFVCLSSRAVHLEVVSSYTTEAFLAALRRFISRRGLCRTLHSDRGTNFVGADKELRTLFRTALLENQQLTDVLATEGIQWIFNPPSAPHFGGLWEAAVKAAKHHLRRVIGDATLTFEEMTTLLAQVEACLNSRPLQALTDDPDDLAALTPGHFLVGSPLNAVPEPSLAEEPSQRLSRWQQLQQMRDHFWVRWSREYLHSLMERPKWRTRSRNFRIGDLCLVRGEQTPPSRWPLARVTDIHPGDDGQVRVATIRTATSTMKRPTVKLIPLLAEPTG